MPIEEFARLFYTMSRMIEVATDPLRISKRAGIVLLLLSKATGGSLTNADLVRKFGSWQLSKTRDGASRDVSKANEELEKKAWVSIHRGPYRISITEDGAKAAIELNESLGRALAVVPAEFRPLLESIVLDVQARKPVGHEGLPGPHQGTGASS